MSRIVPTIGRIVWYVLSGSDVTAINAARAVQRAAVPGWYANEALPGQVYPAMVIRPWGETPESSVNLKVFLDGPDDYWATSRSVSEEPKEGHFHWMPYQKGQAAREAAPA